MRSTAAKLTPLICLLLAFAVVAVYWQVRQFEFLVFDDTIYVSLNPEVHQGLTWKAIVWAFTTNACSNWHPLTWLTHLLDWQLFAGDAGKHHLTNVFFHAASSVLLFLAFKRMTGALWQSAFVAGVFALHPLRVESVAWVAERKDVLSTFFFMLTLRAYAGYAESLKPKVQNAKPSAPAAKGKANKVETKSPESAAATKSRARFHYWLTLALFTLGLMAKPMLVTLPFVLLLLDFWPLKRMAAGETGLGSFLSRLKPLLVEKMPFFILTIGACIVTVWAQKTGGAVVSLHRLPPSFRVANVFVSYLHYVQSFFWPTDLAAPYPYPKDWSLGLTFGAVAMLLALSLTAVMIWRKHPWLAVGWFWFLGMLVPVIGVLQVGAQPFADRYSYLPTIGLTFALAWTVPEILARWPLRNFVLGAASAAILVACIVATKKQVSYWQNTGTWFQHTLAVTKENAFAQNNLAVYYLNNNQYPEAIAHAQAALKIVPDYADPHPTLAFALGESGHRDEAAAHYLIAVKDDPNNSKLHNGYGTVLGMQGKLDQSCEEFAKAIALEPEFVEAHHNWGLTLSRMGKYPEAVQHLKEAVRLRPAYTVAWRTLGNALLNASQLDEAEKAYLECLRQQPSDVLSLLNLGTVYFRQNKFAAAIERFREGLRYDSNNLQLHVNLGLALSAAGQNNDALAELQTALRLQPDSKEIQDQIRRLSK